MYIYVCTYEEGEKEREKEMKCICIYTYIYTHIYREIHTICLPSASLAKKLLGQTPIEDSGSY